MSREMRVPSVAHIMRRRGTEGHQKKARKSSDMKTRDEY
jgi:hypothetical protein